MIKQCYEEDWYNLGPNRLAGVASKDLHSKGLQSKDLHSKGLIDIRPTTQKTYTDKRPTTQKTYTQKTYTDKRPTLTKDLHMCKKNS